MYETLLERVGNMLRRARALKPQTERQIAGKLAEHSASLSAFLLCAADVLEEYELDIIFGPVFTPTLAEWAEVADVVFHWRPTQEQLTQLVSDLVKNVPYALVKLPDGSEAKLTLHEVMVERFVRLLRLDNAPDSATAAALRDALPSELWRLAVALMCEPGMTPRHQRFFAMFVNHMANKRKVSAELLCAVTEFVAGQRELENSKLVVAAEALMRATEGTAAYTASGHAYWSPDVAQHHHYRGQGNIDKERLAQRQAEVQYVSAMVEDLKTFTPAMLEDASSE